MKETFWNALSSYAFIDWMKILCPFYSCILVVLAMPSLFFTGGAEIGAGTYMAEFSGAGFLILFYIWFVGAIICGEKAHAKDRSTIGFFLLSFVISPIISYIILLRIPTPEKHKKEKPEKKPMEKLNDTKQCPYCAETIKRNAIKCHFCGSEISSINKNRFKTS